MIHPNANIIFGSAFNEDMKGKIRISVVATGIDSEEFGKNREEEEESILHEPKRFSVDSDGENSDVVNKSEGFFDPGRSVTVGEDVPQDLGIEIITSDKKKEEPVKEEKVKKERKSLFSRREKKPKEDEEVKIEEIKEKVEEPKPEKDDVLVVETASSEENITQEQEEGKKDASGFSLFSFMNTKAEEDPENDNSQDSEDLYVRPQSKESIEKAEKIVLENESKKHVIPEKKANVEEKRGKFFNSTIFDDDQDDDGGVDDDILNVPAFFRRKKK